MKGREGKRKYVIIFTNSTTHEDQNWAQRRAIFALDNLEDDKRLEFIWEEEGERAGLEAKAFQEKQKFRTVLQSIKDLQRRIPSKQESILSSLIIEEADYIINNSPYHQPQTLKLLIDLLPYVSIPGLEKLAQYIISKDDKLTNAVTTALLGTLESLANVSLTRDSHYFLSLAKYIVEKYNNLAGKVTTALLNILLNCELPEEYDKISVRQLSFDVNLILKYIVDLKQPIEKNKVKQIWNKFKTIKEPECVSWVEYDRLQGNDLAFFAKMIFLMDPALFDEILEYLQTHLKPEDNVRTLILFLKNLGPDGKALPTQTT